MAAINLQQLENASTDADNLGKFANDPAGMVNPRYGAPYKNIRKFLADAEQIGIDAAAASGDSAAQFVLGQRVSFGEAIDRASISLSALNGAVAIDRGLRFKDGNGSPSFISYSARLRDAERELIPVGSIVRVRADFIATAGAAAAIGAPADGFPTQVGRTTDALGQSHQEGDFDAQNSGYFEAQAPAGYMRLIRETTLRWYNRIDGNGNPVYDNSGTETNIINLGGVVQFNNMTPGYAGTFDVVLVGLTFFVDAIPVTAPYSTIADFMRALDRARESYGYAIAYTVGQQAGSDFGNLAQIETGIPGGAPGLKDARADQRQRIIVLPGLNLSKTNLPDNTDLVGLGPDRSFQRNVGAAANKQSWTPADDNILIQGSNLIKDIRLETENSNYVIHSESAGRVQDFVQEIDNCVLRHNGNEAVYQAGVAAGQPNPAIRWTPAVGIGGSSGGEITFRRTKATALKGGGIYGHNTVRQKRPFALRIFDCLVGADDQIGADVFLSTLASGAADICELRNLTMSTGAMGAGFSRADDDPMLARAYQMDFRVFGEQVGRGRFTWTNGFQGRALRIRRNAVNAAYIVGSGAAAEALLAVYPIFPAQIIAEPGRRATLIGGFDVAEYAGWPQHRMGRRLGDCSGVAKALTLDFGDQQITHVFNQDMRNVSNAAILAQLNATFGAIATVDLYDATSTYQPEIFDREHYSLNVGEFGIHFGTMVVLTAGGSFARPAEPDDFMGDGTVKVAGTVFGVALEDIRIGQCGRIQTEGWVAYDQMISDRVQLDVVNNVDPNVGTSFSAYVSADGIHGALKRQPHGAGALKVIRGYLADGQGRAAARALTL